MTDTPIFEGLMAHREKHYSPFHTPGHLNRGFLPQELLTLDFTELPDTDALFEADGMIARGEEHLTRLYGSARSLISAGGCTLAIQAMLALACTGGRKLLFARNSHRSAVNTAALLGIDPIWLLPESGGGFTGRVSASAVAQALEEHPDAAGVYITSPSYYGELSDIPGIAEVCRRHGALLLVDNAHGSHLAFLQENLHPIRLGADLCACSLHKTLPVMTGGAALHIADPVLADGARQKMALFGSTSPSYPIMASIDLCCGYLSGSGRDAYRRLEPRVARIKRLAADRGLSQPEGRCDPLRVSIRTADAGLRGQQAQTAYFHRHLIEPEMCDGTNVVLLCSPFHTEEDFTRVEQAISGLTAETSVPEHTPSPLPEKVLTPREAVLSESERVAVSDAVGRIAAESACPCPPGIPVVVPGERIGAPEASLLLRSGIDTLLCVRGTFTRRGDFHEKVPPTPPKAAVRVVRRFRRVTDNGGEGCTQVPASHG